MTIDLKEEAKRIYFGLMQSVEISRVINEKINIKDDSLILSDQIVDLSVFKEIILIGIGKASIKMGAAIESMLGERLKIGILVSDSKPRTNMKSQVIIAGHPLPDSNSFLAARRIIETINSCGEDSLIIFLLSGGGSALMELPLWDDVTLEDYKQLNKILIRCGASIREINIVRKHLSRVKGGKLGVLAKRSKLITMYVSDVNSGDARSIASNPLAPDDASLEEFYEVINRYSLLSHLPKTIADRIENSAIPELPKEWNSGQTRLSFLLLDNNGALQRAARVARELGFHVEIDTTHEEGAYKQVADELLDELAQLAAAHKSSRVCLLSGGEVSCPVHGEGLGGRNQEYVLYSALRMEDFGINMAVLSCGTDGLDGNSNAAGAVADRETATAARLCGIDLAHHLEQNDSHSFFKQVGDLITTGPAGNNVRDVRILLAEHL